MIKFIVLFVIFICVSAHKNLIWYKIPMFYVSDYVVNFINSRQINNCFYKFENEDTLLLKCWKNNNIVNVQINIKNDKRSKNYDSVYI